MSFFRLIEADNHFFVLNVSGLAGYTLMQLMTPSMVTIAVRMEIILMMDFRNCSLF